MTRRPLDPFPPRIVEMARWVRARTSRGEPYIEPLAHLGFDFDAGLTARVCRTKEQSHYFGYHGLPFEFLTFGWQGGDALQYGYLVHAPELAAEVLSAFQT